MCCSLSCLTWPACRQLKIRLEDLNLGVFLEAHDKVAGLHDSRLGVHFKLSLQKTAGPPRFNGVRAIHYFPDSTSDASHLQV